MNSDMRFFYHLLFLLLIMPVGTAAAAQDTLRFSPDGDSEVFFTTDVRIALVATSTVKGVNSNIGGTIEWIQSDPRPVIEARIEIDAAKFDSGNNARDREVRKLLDVDNFPYITFELESVLGIENKPVTELNGQYISTGYLTVRGIKKEISVPVYMNFTDGILFIEGSTAAKYTDFGIDPPRVAGFIGRVPDALRLHISIVAKGV